RKREPPNVLGLVIACRVDAAVELHVATQVEFVRDVVQVAQILGLAGELLLPMPFMQELAREGVTVGVAFRIEAAAGIAVPIPGTAEIGRAFQDDRLDPEIDQPLDLVDARHPGADHDDLIVDHGLLLLPCLTMLTPPDDKRSAAKSRAFEHRKAIPYPESRCYQASCLPITRRTTLAIDTGRATITAMRRQATTAHLPSESA